MKSIMKTCILLVAFVLTLSSGLSAESTAKAASIAPLRGSSGYTPYDWCGLRWAREGGEMVWVNSGADALRLLVSKADSSGRPDWIFCSQGAVAGQAARGARLVVLATVYVSPDAVRPIFRVPRQPIEGARSVFIPRSSIEVAFDHLLERERVAATSVRVPRVESPSFNTIVSLLSKPATDRDAIDFAVLVEPFLSNLVASQPGSFEIGPGGIYELNYCLVAREEDARARRLDYIRLLRQFAAISSDVEGYTADEQFYAEVWGRKRDDQPEKLPKLLTFGRAPARLQLDAKQVRRLIRDEVEHLVAKYPADLRRPADIDAFVDDSLLLEAAPKRVIR